MAQKIYRVIPLQYERSSCGGNSLPRSIWTKHFSLYFCLLPSFSSAYHWNFLSRLNYPLEILCLHIEKKKKKRREKRLKPSNTLLVSAFVCFRVWERSRGDIDERKIAAIVSQSVKQRNYNHQVPCILTWGTGWLLGALGGVGSLGYRESLKNLEFFFFFNLY